MCGDWHAHKQETWQPLKGYALKQAAINLRPPQRLSNMHAILCAVHTLGSVTFKILCFGLLPLQPETSGSRESTFY